MAEGFDPNKTEAPTPRRREKAREEGQVVFSPDLNSAAALLLAASAALWLAPMICAQLQSLLRTRVQMLDGANWDIAATILSVRWLVNYLWAIAGGVAISFLGLSLLLSQAQTGFLVAFKPLSPNWERLDPVQGFQRLWSTDSAMRGLLAVVKLLTLGSVATALFFAWQGAIQSGTRGPLDQSIQVGWKMTAQMMLCLAGAAFVWGVADYGFRWWRNEQKLRMTKEELKDEHKEEQGDPQLKARIRRMQREASQRKTLKEIPKATVIIANPTHFAVALKYEAGRMKAPKVVAKGKGAFARQIKKIAQEHGVPVLERKPLARALYALAKVGHEIPMEFYRAVAEILAYVYRIKNQRAG
jgi:flagellar biosynthetic protein FlhB